MSILLYRLCLFIFFSQVIIFASCKYQVHPLHTQLLILVMKLFKTFNRSIEIIERSWMSKGRIEQRIGLRCHVSRPYLTVFTLSLDMTWKNIRHMLFKICWHICFIFCKYFYHQRLQISLVNCEGPLSFSTFQNHSPCHQRLF